MRCKAFILMAMIVAVHAHAQFLDPLEKATLDFYYDNKTNSIAGARIVDGSLTTNKFAASILELWLPRDGSRAMQAALPMGGYRITNLGAPTAPTDATTKAYVDNSFTNIFSGPGTTGLVTSVAAETNRFLRGDGAWSAPLGSGDFLRDGTIPMTGPLNFGGNKGTNVANGTISNDVASLWQVWNATNTLWSTILSVVATQVWSFSQYPLALTNPAEFATSAQGTSADTAFGWGDHATNGYLTVVSADDGSGIWGITKTLELTPLEHALTYTAGLWVLNAEGDVTPTTGAVSDTTWVLVGNEITTK